MWVKIFDNYEISETGVVRNTKTGAEIKQYVGKDGYLRTQIAGKTRTVHRLVACAFVPATPGKDFVNHIDGNKQNNAANNLEWVTRSENMKHAYCNNLKTSNGSKNGRHKLDESDVAFIRKRYVKGSKEYGCLALAKKYGVAHQTISAVTTNQNWKEIKPC